jgi:hypothetical protein
VLPVNYYLCIIKTFGESFILQIALKLMILDQKIIPAEKDQRLMQLLVIQFRQPISDLVEVGV